MGSTSQGVVLQYSIVWGMCICKQVVVYRHTRLSRATLQAGNSHGSEQQPRPVACSLWHVLGQRCHVLLKVSVHAKR